MIDMDKIKLSCLVCFSDVNTTADKTRQFCLVSTQFPICNCSVSNTSRIEDWNLGRSMKQNSSKLDRDKTKLSCLVCSCVHTADVDKIVLSWCEQAIRSTIQTLAAAATGPLCTCSWRIQNTLQLVPRICFNTNINTIHSPFWDHVWVLIGCSSSQLYHCCREFMKSYWATSLFGLVFRSVFCSVQSSE